MSQSVDREDDTPAETTYREYVLNVRVQEVGDGDAVRYRFEAPEHTEVTFPDPDKATLYADVYFGVNGFVEDGTGRRGIPPEVVIDGKDTMAAYLVTRTSVNWVASLYGAEPTRIQRYIRWVRERAEEIREQVRERDEG